MNVLTYPAYRTIFLNEDGSSRNNLLTAVLHRSWKVYASFRMELRRLVLPQRTLKVCLRDGQSEMIRQFPYEHLVVPESGGYFSIGREGGNFFVDTLCENDHLGPGAKYCLYVDGIPLDRREKRFVSPTADIVFFDYIDTRASSNNWRQASYRVVPLAI